MGTMNKQQMVVLPLATIQGAYVKFSGQTPTDKSVMIQWLDGQIESGLMTLDNVRQSLPFVLPLQQSNPAVEAVANDAKAVALESVELIKILQKSISRQDESIVKLEESIADIANVGIDQSEITRKVESMIDTAFAPFKQAVIETGSEAKVANLSNVYKIGRESCKDLFGIDLPLEFDVYNDPTAPAIDPCFIWTESILRTLAFAQDTGRNTWFGGEKGTGKSQTAQEFSARTGRGFMRYNFHKYTTASDYLGDVGLDNGATVFKQGDFLRAYTAPSTVILLDEITNADQGELAPLNGFLEPNAKVTYGGRVWSKAEGVIIFGADNTLLNGDVTGRYAGTRTTNTALADRFTAVIKFTFLPLTLEVEAVVKHTGCHKELALHVLKAVQTARAKVETGDILDAPSIRQVIGFIQAVPYLGMTDAWEAVMVNRQVEDSGIALRGIGSACLNADIFSKYLGARK